MIRDIIGGDSAAFSTLMCHLICPDPSSTHCESACKDLQMCAVLCQATVLVQACRCAELGLWVPLRSLHQLALQRKRPTMIGQGLEDVAIEALAFCGLDGGMSYHELPPHSDESLGDLCSCTRLALPKGFWCGWWRSQFRPVGALDRPLDGAWNSPLSTTHERVRHRLPSQIRSRRTQVMVHHRVFVSIKWKIDSVWNMKLWGQSILTLVLAMVLTRASSFDIFHRLFLASKSHLGGGDLLALAKIIAMDWEKVLAVEPSSADLFPETVTS